MTFIGNPIEVPDKLYMVKITLSNFIELYSRGPQVQTWGDQNRDRMPALHTVPNMCPEPVFGNRAVLDLCILPMS